MGANYIFFYWLLIVVMVLWMAIKVARVSTGMAVATFFCWPIAVIPLITNWGQRDSDIRLQFLTEALMLSVVGGLIGTLVGISGAYIFGALSDMRTVIQASSILLAFGSAAAVGAFFGYYPANQAAQLDPIEALRYE